MAAPRFVRANLQPTSPQEARNCTPSPSSWAGNPALGLLSAMRQGGVSALPAPLMGGLLFVFASPPLSAGCCARSRSCFSPLPEGPASGFERALHLGEHQLVCGSEWASQLCDIRGKNSPGAACAPGHPLRGVGTALTSSPLWMTLQPGGRAMHRNQRSAAKWRLATPGHACVRVGTSDIFAAWPSSFPPQIVSTWRRNHTWPCDPTNPFSGGDQR